MANEIDLYKDLDRCNEMIKGATENDDKLMINAWKKEKIIVIKKIKINYPDLVL